jgi:hypothetical protein
MIVSVHLPGRTISTSYSDWELVERADMASLGAWDRGSDMGRSGDTSSAPPH